MNNILNKTLTKKVLEKLINSYTEPEVTVKIKNIKKFQKAFVHKSFCIVDSDNSDTDNYSNMYYEKDDIYSNERLEFLGDKVIDLITTEFLFDKYPTKDEGFLTKLKSRIVKKEGLAYLGEKLGFKELLLISSHVERISGRENPRFLEDTLESFIGILYKDQNSDLNICRRFLLEVYARHLDLDSLINNNDNYKDSLLRYFHSKNWGNPEYICEETENKEFSSIITLESNKLDWALLERIGGKDIQYNDKIVIGKGHGKTKKIAQQESSKKCLLNLGISTNY